MSTTVHILNGDSTSYPLQKSGLEGDIIVWREMLCEGPIVKDVGSDDFWMHRYEFFSEELHVDKLEYYDKTIKELIVIEDLSQYKEVVLWFEYDLFCQVNLMALCTYLLKHYRKDVFYYLVCTGKEKGREDWQTLGDYSPAEYRNLYENKIKISRNDFLFANECWDVYVEGSKEDLENFDFGKNHKFKYLDIAIKQHIKNFKDKRGLNQIAYKILQIIGNNQLHKKEVIKELLLWQREHTVYGFGDLQYAMKLDALEEYFDSKDEVYYLNKKGRELVT